MSRNKNASRKRSTFKKSSGTTLSRGAVLTQDGFGKTYKVARQVGGHGQWLNGCRCKSCN